MSEHADKAQEQKNALVADAAFQRDGGQDAMAAIADNRPQAAMQRKLQQAASNSPRVQQLKSVQQKVAGAQAPARLQAPVATQSGPAPVQRLKWSEVHTGTRTNIGLTASQMPKGVAAVEGEGATVDRNVFASQKKGTSGFLWFKEDTLEVRYDIASMQQYEIIDASVVFHTAVRESAVGPIREKGIDPNYGNAEKPDGSTQYNTRGFNYFGKDEKVPTIYGKNYLAPEKWTILNFRLPLGTKIERDPEIPNGLRTTYHIQPGDLV